VKEKRKITKPFKKLTLCVLKLLIDLFDLQNDLGGKVENVNYS
jgi:hypothetical protein